MTAHIYKDIVYHIVFTTKHRTGVITTQMMRRIRELFNENAARHGFTIHITHGRTDHVHVLVSAPPKWSVSDIVKNLKGYSSFKIPGLYWQRGYGVFTVDRDSFDRVFKYIKNQ